MNDQPHLKLLIPQKKIYKAIERLAKQISNDYKNSTPLLIGVLKGSFIFMADLIRHRTINVEITFIELSSYGDSTECSGTVKFVKSLDVEISGRDVLIIEDIIDTGITISALINYLEKRKPLSIKLCSLTSKPSRREKDVNIDYLGFEIPNKFIIGYGFDFKEKYRNLPEIYYLQP